MWIKDALLRYLSRSIWFISNHTRRESCFERSVLFGLIWLLWSEAITRFHANSQLDVGFGGNNSSRVKNSYGTPLDNLWTCTWQSCHVVLSNMPWSYTFHDIVCIEPYRDSSHMTFFDDVIDSDLRVSTWVFLVTWSHFCYNDSLYRFICYNICMCKVYLDVLVDILTVEKYIIADIWKETPVSGFSIFFFMLKSDLW